MKEAETFRVQELVKKIESHPHRDALQADSQQNNVYNPFSNNSKEMIRELGNVELFELCETIPKVQGSQCLLYWNQGGERRTEGRGGGKGTEEGREREKGRDGRENGRGRRRKTQGREGERQREGRGKTEGEGGKTEEGEGEERQREGQRGKDTDRGETTQTKPAMSG